MTTPNDAELPREVEAAITEFMINHSHVGDLLRGEGENVYCTVEDLHGFISSLLSSQRAEVDELMRAVNDLTAAYTQEQEKAERLQSRVVELEARWVEEVLFPDGHDSDCAMHNEPAKPNGACDCSLSAQPTAKEAKDEHHE